MESSEFRLHALVEDEHWWFRARREIIRDRLRRLVPPGQGKTIVEIGCGTGGNLRFLEDGYRVLGVDMSPDAVTYARERVNGEVFLGDFREMLADRWLEIDAVLLPDLLEHVPDDRSLLTDCVKSLRPGAVVLITVPAHPFLWSRHDKVLGHLRRYTAADFRSLWKGLGVDETFVSPFNCLLFPLIALLRVIGIGQESTESDLKLPSPLVNRLLYRIFAGEKTLMRLVPLPFGVSFLAVLRKKG
jgi:SAM-dependent methyltransferase